MSGREDVRVFLKAYLAQTSRARGQELPAELSDDSDLMQLGVLDSLGLVNLMTAITEHFGAEIDFEELDPEQMTIVGPLCTFVSSQLEKAGSGKADGAPDLVDRSR